MQGQQGSFTTGAGLITVLGFMVMIVIVVFLLRGQDSPKARGIAMVLASLGALLTALPSVLGALYGN